MRAIEYKYQLEKKREENEFRKFSSQLLMLLNKKKLINVCKTSLNDCKYMRISSESNLDFR